MSEDMPRARHGGPPVLYDPEAPCPVCDEPLGYPSENPVCWLVQREPEIRQYVYAGKFHEAEQPGKFVQGRSLVHRECAEEVLS